VRITHGPNRNPGLPPRITADVESSNHLPELRVRLKYVLSLLSLSVACGGDDARQALVEPVIDTLASGVVRVTNNGPTAWADTNGWKIVLEREIKPEEGSPGELSSSHYLAADDAGNVYVLQQSPARIAKFGPDGEWIKDIGREGDGPGEFRNGMIGVIGDTIFIQDPNNTRITTFLTDGTPIASHTSQCCWFTSRLNTLSNGAVLIPGPPPNSESRGALFATHLDGRVIDTLLQPPESDVERESYWELVLRSGNSTSMSRMTIPFHPFDLTTVRPDGKIVRGRSSEYRLVIGNDFTDTLRIFSASAPTISVSEAQRDSAYDVIRSRMPDRFREEFDRVAKKSDMPGTWPVWSGFHSDSDNNIWVALPGERGAYSTYQVFNPDGILLGSVNGPGANLFSGYWTRTHIYMPAEDEDGLPYVRVYRIVKQ
jgi:hypothetical protein